MSGKYAFIDRDGTLIFEPQDTFQIDSLEKLKILDGAIEGLKLLLERDYKLVMVSNQNGVGTSSFPLKSFEIPQSRMLEVFSENGIEFEQIFICPHLPEDACGCRKPKIGLVAEFLRNLDIDFGNSMMLGDRDTDRQFAKNIGVKFAYVPTNGNFLIAVNKFFN